MFAGGGGSVLLDVSFHAAQAGANLRQLTIPPVPQRPQRHDMAAIPLDPAAAYDRRTGPRNPDLTPFYPAGYSARLPNRDRDSGVSMS